MERWIMLDGVDTREYGVRVMNLPPVAIPQERATLTAIPGRSGYLTYRDGAYETISRAAGLFYNGPRPDHIARVLQGATRAIFSNEPDKEYKLYPAQMQTDITRVIAEWHRFTFDFLCDPEKREAAPTRITATAPPVVLVNPGNRPARPTIELTGTGNVTLTVGEYEIELADIGTHITVDGDLLDCHQSGTNANLKMTGLFPVIEPGETVEISWTGSVTKVSVWPNWRWV
jgi:phage-related protein